MSEVGFVSAVMGVIEETIYSPLNLVLVLIIGFLMYKIIKDRFGSPAAGQAGPVEPQLPKMRRDFTPLELRSYDGTQPDGRVLLAVNGRVYDVTKGKRFYGPGGPYGAFAGRDATRNLATFSLSNNDNCEYDDLSDLSAMEMDSVREWELQFNEKYEYVGKLLRAGEQPTNYEDEEEDTISDVANTSTTENNSTENAAEPVSSADGIRKRETTNAI